MTSMIERIRSLTDSQRSAFAAELDHAARVSVAEPIAVVGIGCRFSGVDGPERLWQMLVEGRNMIGEVPRDRWDADALYDADPQRPGHSPSRWGSFLEGVSRFDAEYFGIAPREADMMDPQQRILLEVVWEALEHANIPAESLAGKATGVMMGVYYDDYRAVLAAGGQTINAYTATGTSHSLAVGRIAYRLDSSAPAVAVDTACSSSLVAIHLACQSLRTRESDLALAGGVSTILSPEAQIAISQWGLLSPTGQCRTFDAAADGFVRGEGCGVVVLKRMTDALSDGDDILALVRSSATNQDGRSNGVTSPSMPAQRRLIESALERCGLAAHSIGYVEAHGTATLIGDPIEVQALRATYGAGDRPCALGSIKTNLGHLEAAAGVAGFIKAVLAVRHGFVPPHLNFREWNPEVGDPGRLFVPTTGVPWPDQGGPRRAAVSSFGLGGTNAHLIIEEAPIGAAHCPHPESVTRERGATECDPPVELVISGRTIERIRATAGRLADRLADTDQALADVAHTLDHHRDHHRMYATVICRERPEAVRGLHALADGTLAPGVITAHEGRCPAGAVFVYSGQGSQWPGMGRGLLEREPAFAAALVELEPAFRSIIGFSLLDIVRGGQDVRGADRVQPVLVGLQLAMTRMWQAHGIEPVALIGHSVGEITAAVAAGALSTEAGLRVVGARSRAMHEQLSGSGSVALLEATRAAAHLLTADLPGVAITGHQSPTHTVVAGPAEAIRDLIEQRRREGHYAAKVLMDTISHHPRARPAADVLYAELADLVPAAPRIPVYSTTFDSRDERVARFDAEHWRTNLLVPVHLEEAVAAAGRRYATFVEISPHPVLLRSIEATLATRPGHRHVHATIERPPADGGGDEQLTFHRRLAEVAASLGRRREAPHPTSAPAHLPTTPWLHSRHWCTPAADTSGAIAAERSVAALVAASIHAAEDRPGAHREDGVAIDSGTDIEPPTTPGAAYRLARAAVSDSRDIDALDVADITVDPAAARLEGPATTRLQVVGCVDAEVEVRIDRVAPEGSQPVASVRFRRSARAADRSSDAAVSASTSTAVELPVPAAGDDPAGALLDAVVDLIRSTPDTAGRQIVRVEDVPTVWSDRPGRLVTPSGAVRRGIDSAVSDIGVTVLDAESAAVTAQIAVRLDDGAERPAREWIHRSIWRQAPPPPAWDPRPVLVVSGADIGQTLTAALIDAGADPASTVHVPWPDMASEPADSQQRWIPDTTSTALVLVIPPISGDPLAPTAARELFAATRRLVLEVAQYGSGASVAVVTRAGRAIDPGERVDAAHAALWGLGRTLALECATVWAGLIDVDPRTPASLWALPCVANAQRADGESEVVLRGTRRLVPRLVTAPPRLASGAALRSGSRLVIGATGKLGTTLIRQLVRDGADHIVAVSRHPEGQLDELVAEMGSAGVDIVVAACDVTVEESVANLLARFGTDLPELRGIYLITYSGHPVAIESMSEADIATMFATKIDAAERLHRLTMGLTLDHFVTFSSISGVLGSRWLGHYGATTTYLNALAHNRRADGLVATSPNWGPWTSFAAADTEVAARVMMQSGFELMDDSRAIGLLAALTEPESDPNPTVASVNWAMLSAAYGTRTTVRTIEELLTESTAGGGAISRALAEAAPAARPGLLHEAVREMVAGVLGVEIASLDPTVGFFQIGMDSLMSVDLQRALCDGLARALPLSVVFDYPTVDALTDHLMTVLPELRVEDGADPAAGDSDAQTPPDHYDALSEDDLLRTLAERLVRSDG